MSSIIVPKRGLILPKRFNGPQRQRGFIMSPYRFGGGGGGGSDPYIGNVIALFNMGGADGSTTFTDATGRSWTTHGGAEIDTSLGYNAGLFPAAGGGYLTATTDTGTALGTGSYTIEAWVYITAYKSALAPIWDTLPVGGAGARNNSTVFFIASTGKLVAFSRGSSYAQSSGAVPLNTLVHIAESRDGSGAIRHFIGGTLDGSVGVSAVDDNQGGLNVGVLGDSAGNTAAHFRDWLVALRVTKGVARYTANFTPPSAPFPTS